MCEHGKHHDCHSHRSGHGHHDCHGHHGHAKHHRCATARCCKSGHSFKRRFFTREERIAWLEEYLEELQAEAEAVEERIANMKEEG